MQMSKLIILETADAWCALFFVYLFFSLAMRSSVGRVITPYHISEHIGRVTYCEGFAWFHTGLALAGHYPAMQSELFSVINRACNLSR
ncbi:hypothetical protein BDW42DRAFT_158232 [Aspergillus taichungensis]|uniref:Uncharacterized protein n=1 Tax=Aspergillus taichungensis TaxID=482145 RepID=A0A2J5I9D3_9EURO|nr:hypothetical protein BDW42DRAFT_158232 [Aspergillus taichungensis]